MKLSVIQHLESAWTLEIFSVRWHCVLYDNYPGLFPLKTRRCAFVPCCADYTKGEALPTDGIESLAPCVSAVVMKDCTLNPNSPQVRSSFELCSQLATDRQSSCMELIVKSSLAETSVAVFSAYTSAARQGSGELIRARFYCSACSLLTHGLYVGTWQEEEYEVDEGEPLPKVDVLVLPGTGKVDFDPLLSALQSPVRFPVLVLHLISA